jgi:hypothetical protein
MFKSADNGQTWKRASNAADVTLADEISHDNLATLADPTAAGVVYMATTRYESVSNGVEKVSTGMLGLFRSLDHGQTWRRLALPVAPDAGSRVSAPEFAYDRKNARLFVAYVQEKGGRSSVEIVSSTDQGATWSSPRKAVDLVALLPEAGTQIHGARITVAADIAHIAVDSQSGQLFVVFVDGRHSTDIPQISLITSADQGVSWSPPMKIDANNSGPTYLPAITTNSAGEAAILYFSHEAMGKRKSAATLPTAVKLARFKNGPDGLSQTATTVIDQFNMLGAPWRSGYGVGDYNGLIATADGLLAIYAKSLCAPFSINCTTQRRVKSGDYTAVFATRLSSSSAK